MTQNIREQTQIFIFGRKIFEFKLFFATACSSIYYSRSRINYVQPIQNIRGDLKSQF